MYKESIEREKEKRILDCETKIKQFQKELQEIKEAKWLSVDFGVVMSEYISTENNLYVGGYAALCTELLTLSEIEKVGYSMERVERKYSVTMYVYTIFGIKKVFVLEASPDFCGFTLYQEAINSLINQFKDNKSMVGKLRGVINKRKTKNDKNS